MTNFKNGKKTGHKNRGPYSSLQNCSSYFFTITQDKTLCLLKLLHNFAFPFGVPARMISRCPELVYIELSYYFVPTAVLKKERSGLRD